ncbi:MAG: hypothetical protein ACT6U0_19360 [Shinella sp.]
MRWLFFAMIETGCRPSKLRSLEPEDIHLDANVPFTAIIFTDDRR